MKSSPQSRYGSWRENRTPHGERAHTTGLGRVEGHGGKPAEVETYRGTARSGERIICELHPSCARDRLLPVYRRREPERTLQYAVVRDHLQTFLAARRDSNPDGADPPSYVEREFERDLECGILAHGFVRVRCDECGHDRVVAFSCRGRAVCPSCNAQRMHQTAAHLVDRVLPPGATYRQWVLSLPRWVRFRLAYRPVLVSQVLQLFVRAIFACPRRRARRRGIRDGQPGSVTFIQRFGSALNLNVHFHVLVPDGVFSAHSGEVSFVALEPPPDEEVEAVARKVARRTRTLLESWRIATGCLSTYASRRRTAPPSVKSR